MALTVDNLNNLFWDNGSWKYPNTYPKLVGGKYLPNVTPVMTSPLMGWVVLTGEWNYALFNENLYFLKKGEVISLEKNKFKYYLIKDHICSLFRNKANVIAIGTITNIDLKHLHDKDFQFTFPVFTSYNKKIILPLTQEKYNWKKHLKKVQKISKNFSDQKLFGNAEFTDLINTLKANKELFQTKGINLNEQKKHKHFTLLGKTNRVKKEDNWKNQLAKKINEFLDSLQNPELNKNIVFGKVNPTVTNSPCIKNKWVITCNKNSLATQAEETKQILEGSLNLSGLEDIVLISGITGKEDSSRAYFHFQFKDLGGNLDHYIGAGTYIKKLTRRVRTPLLNPYTSRAIYRSGEKFSTWFYKKPNSEHLLPQKIFFEIRGNLKQPEKDYLKLFPQERSERVFRSVYLYICWYLNFTIQFSQYPEAKRHTFKETNFIDPEKYFGGPEKCKENINCALAESTVYAEQENKALEIIKDSYSSYYPWEAGSDSEIQEPLNIGWLVGQFSPFIENNDVFDPNASFLVKKTQEKLKRINGLKEIVSTLINENKVFKKLKNEAFLGKEEHPLDLDIFGCLPPRFRQATLEEDNLIGEKLLFTTWGLPTYLLFQPGKYYGYSRFDFSDLDKSINGEPQLIGKWLGIKDSWAYGYYTFDSGSYFQEHAKSWFKKAYDNFKTLDYKRFYQTKESFKTLKEHIKKNTEAYFQTEEITWSKTPIGALEKGDIFFSDQEWFFFDSSEAKDLSQAEGDWFNKEIDKTVDIETDDLLVYYDFEEGKINLGEATVWADKVKLPEGQFIALDAQIENSSSANQELPIKYYKVKKKKSFTSFDEVINALTANVNSEDEKLFSHIADISLESQKGFSFLFDLKGTNFYCWLDSQGQIHLIFKEERGAIDNVDKQIFSISGDEDLDKLTRSQWVNQQVKLSYYGQKLELPIKAFEKKVIATIHSQLVSTGAESVDEFDLHKVEVEHDLGTVYFRLNIPKNKTYSTQKFSAFGVEDLNIQNNRNLQDYINSRREYELDFQRMELGHQQARFEQWQNLANSIVGAITSTVGVAASAATGGLAGAALQNLWNGGKIGGFAKGTSAIVGGISGGVKASSGIFGSVMGLMASSQRRAILEEKINLDLKEKVFQSYNIDLAHARQKINHVNNLRKAFAQDSYNPSTSRQREEKLDNYEEKLKNLPEGQKEIYLEVWTTSDKQEERVVDYHAKHGVECRIPDAKLVLKNGIEPGIYQLEDVEILNLKDRLELMFLKARLEIGLKIVPWIEHEKIEELIPVDPRIIQLQKALQLAEKKQIEFEQSKLLQEAKFQELEKELKKDEEELKLEKNASMLYMTERDEALKKNKILENDKKTLSNELEKNKTMLRVEAQRYSALEIEKKEVEKKFTEAEEGRLKLETEKTKCLQEKAQLLQEKNKCLEDSQKKNQELEGQIEQLKTELEGEKHEVENQKSQLAQLQKEKEQASEISKAELEKLKREKQEAETREASEKNQRETAEAAKRRAEEESSRVKAELENCKNGAKTKENEFKQQLVDKDNQLKSAQQDKATKERELEEVKKEIEKCKSDAEEQQRELFETKEKLEKLEEAGVEPCFFPSGYLNQIFVNTLAQFKKRRASPLLMVIPEKKLDKEKRTEATANIKILRWSSELQIFLEDKYYDCIWSYDGYKLFYVGNSNNNNQSEAKNLVIDDSYWNSYSGGSYFSHKITTWEDVKHHILGAHEGAEQKACINWEHVIFSDNCFNIPYIPKEELREVGKPWEEHFKLELNQPDQEDATTLNCLYTCEEQPDHNAWLWDKQEKKFFFGPNKEKGGSPRYWYPYDIKKPWEKITEQEGTELISVKRTRFSAIWWRGRTKEVTAFFYWFLRMVFEDTFMTDLKKTNEWQGPIFKKLVNLWEKKPELATELYNHFIKNVEQVNNYGDYKKVLKIERPPKTPLFRKISTYVEE